MFKDLKVIFMGTPEFSIPTLKMLYENTNLKLVVTQPDKIFGRKKELKFSPVKIFANDNNIKVFQPEKIRNDYQMIVDLKPDLIVTAAYGQIIPKEVLNSARLGCLNIHGSILPSYRGAAPVQYALINGEEKTGITLMYMDETMDTGDIIDIKEIDIDYEDNYVTLLNKLSYIGSDILFDNLESIVNETNNRIKQNEKEVTYAGMIKRDDEYISFNDYAKNIHNKIRGIYPNAYTLINGEVLKILKTRYVEKKVDCSSKVSVINKNELGINALDGIIYLDLVKPFGKKEMDVKSYINGLKNKDNIIVGKNE